MEDSAKRRLAGPDETGTVRNGDEAQDRAASEPDPNPTKRTGGKSDKLGKSLQQEDYK